MTPCARDSTAAGSAEGRESLDWPDMGGEQAWPPGHGRGRHRASPGVRTDPVCAPADKAPACPGPSPGRGPCRGPGHHPTDEGRHRSRRSVPNTGPDGPVNTS